MSDEKRPNIIETALAAGIAQHCIVDADGVKLALVPKGCTLEDLERFGYRPRRLSAAPIFVSLDSFIAYLEEFKNETSKVYADSVTGCLCARIDGHAVGAPSFMVHSARFAPKETEEWKRWKAKDNQYLSQSDFAEFIESNVQDITRPDGATMLEIAKTFEAKTSTEFKSGVRLDNGNHKLTFAQETTARAGTSNELEIPTEFDLALIPFAFGEAFPITARLRYRVGDDKALKFKYQLINPHKVIESVVLWMINKVSEDTEIKPLIGAA